MGVLKPSGNGLYLMPHQPEPPPDPMQIPRLVPAPVLPSLPTATQYCGTPVLTTLICKARMPGIPTVSQPAPR
jgi:hypothetical protein